ncbi:MAG: DMT family transporter [Clostridiales bacterium]|nr:DMT family transporter [Clostridiales bacterium]
MRHGWALLAAAAFSLEGLLARGAMATGTHPVTALWLRFLLAWMGVAATQLLRPPRDGHLASKDRYVLLTAGVGYAATALLLFAAFQRIPTSLAILLLYLYPALVAVGSHLLGRDRLTPRHAMGLLLAFSGLLLLTGASFKGSFPGMLLAFGAALTNALTLLLQDPVMERVSAYRALTPLLGSATLTSLFLALALGKPLFPQEGSWPYLVGLALFPSVVAILGVNRSLQVLGASRTALLLSLEPPLAALWGALWLDERWTLWQLVGGLLIVLGVTWVQTEDGESDGMKGAAG